MDKIIREMKNSRSSGLDNIDSYIIKLVREELTPALTHMINLSIGAAVFPSRYKVSKVSPLYKGVGDRMDPSSYRPVSLLPSQQFLSGLLSYKLLSTLIIPQENAE